MFRDILFNIKSFVVGKRELRLYILQELPKFCICSWTKESKHIWHDFSVAMNCSQFKVTMVYLHFKTSLSLFSKLLLWKFIICIQYAMITSTTIFSIPTSLGRIPVNIPMSSLFSIPLHLDYSTFMCVSMGSSIGHYKWPHLQRKITVPPLVVINYQ